MHLDFLGAIEGLSGEELVSGALHFLTVHSPIFRERLTARIATKLPKGLTPSFRNGIFCRTEAPTTYRESTAPDAEEAAGRIDLLICDGEPRKATFALAIEVKLWAAFTRDQPGKYLPRLKSLVGDGNDAPLLIAVICPDERFAKVEQHVGAQGITKQTAVWRWKQIRDDIEHTAQEEGGLVASAATWLLRYLDGQLGSVLLPGDRSAYVGSQVELGNYFHEEFLYRLKAFVPLPGKMSWQAEYVGFACRAVETDPLEKGAPAWIGFRKLTDGQVVFGIHTSLPAPPGPTEWFGREFRTLEFSANTATQNAAEWGDRLQRELAEIQARYEACSRKPS